jgi:hypothetical protein
MAGPPPPVQFDTRSTCKVCGKVLTADEIVRYGDYCAAHFPFPPPSEDDEGGWGGGGDDDAAADSG